MSPIRSVAAVLGAAGLALAACNPPTASPNATAPQGTPVASATPPASNGAPTAVPTSGADAQVYAQIRDQIVAIRGLEATAEVDPVTIDEAQLLENLKAEIDAVQTPEIFAISEDILGTLGLIEPGSSLRDQTLDLLAGQVLGYYSPDRDELYVVSKSGEPLGAIERATYAHEFTHQLQDQTFDLDSFDTTAIDQSDRALAHLALIEGDASLAQTLWLFEHLTPEELGEVIAAGEDPDAQAALDNAPAYLRDTSVFPYLSGLLFVQTIFLDGGFAAVNALFDDPPASSEQIIHPEKYLDRDAPADVRIPDGLAQRVGDGWTEAAQDTLGELILRTWLDEHGVGVPTTGLIPGPSEEAAAATAGWGGDRLALLRGPEGALAVAMRTTWDSAGDAAEFAAAVEIALEARGFEGRLFHRTDSREVLVAIGDEAPAVLAALRG